MASTWVLNAVRHAVVRTGPIARQAGVRLGKTVSVREREDATNATRLPAFVGALGGASVWSGVSDDELAAASTPAYGVPKSIEMLAVNNIPVKPQMLLDNVCWDVLRGSPLMTSDEHVEIRDEIAAMRSRLESYRERNYRIDGKTACAMAQKFGTWLCVHELLCCSLQTSDEGRGHLNEVIESMGEDVEQLQKRNDNLARLLKEGLEAKANLAAQSAITHHQQLWKRLSKIQAQVRRLKEERWAQTLKLVGGAGACIVVGVSCEYLGVFTSAPEGLVTLLRDASLCGAVACLSGAALRYFLDDEFAALQRSVEESRLNSAVLRSQLQGLLDDCVGI